jgi:photosystem II stability/assembly factor-like uncharacterized protein
MGRRTKGAALAAVLTLAVTATSCSSTPPSATTPIAKEGAVTAITCSSATHCLALGPKSTSAGILTYATVSDDGGQHWHVTKKPPAMETPTGMSCWDAMHCMAVSISGAEVTADGGVTWTHPPNPPLRAGFNGAVSCPAANTCVLVGTSFSNTSTAPTTAGTATTVPVTIAPAAAVTSDGGSTWTVHPIPVQVPPGSVACLNATTCLAASSSTGPNSAAVVAKTTDGGTTWSSIAGPAIGSPTNVACAPNTSTCVLLGSKSIAAATADGGSSWTTTRLQLAQLGKLARLQQASCSTTSHCIVTTLSHVVKVSTDGGKSYSTSELEGGSNSQSAYCNAGTTCLVGGALGATNVSPGLVLRSTDGGKTWSQVWEGV